MYICEYIYEVFRLRFYFFIFSLSLFFLASEYHSMSMNLSISHAFSPIYTFIARRVMHLTQFYTYDDFFFINWAFKRTVALLPLFLSFALWLLFYSSSIVINIWSSWRIRLFFSLLCYYAQEHLCLPTLIWIFEYKSIYQIYTPQIHHFSWSFFMFF